MKHMHMWIYIHYQMHIFVINFYFTADVIIFSQFPFFREFFIIYTWENVKGSRML